MCWQWVVVLALALSALWPILILDSWTAWKLGRVVRAFPVAACSLTHDSPTKRLYLAPTSSLMRLSMNLEGTGMVQATPIHLHDVVSLKRTDVSMYSRHAPAEKRGGKGSVAMFCGREGSPRVAMFCGREGSPRVAMFHQNDSEGERASGGGRAGALLANLWPQPSEVQSVVSSSVTSHSISVPSDSMTVSAWVGFG